MITQTMLQLAESIPTMTRKELIASLVQYHTERGLARITYILPDCVVKMGRREKNVRRHAYIQMWTEIAAFRNETFPAPLHIIVKTKDGYYVIIAEKVITEDDMRYDDLLPYLQSNPWVSDFELYDGLQVGLTSDLRLVAYDQGGLYYGKGTRS